MNNKEFNVGDFVEKVDGTYTFVGHIVAKFTKLSGEINLVVEDNRGILLVCNEQLINHKE